MADVIFGSIPGVEVGQHFSDRRELHDANVHRGLMKGIAPAGSSIVLSGGYVDDEDYGDDPNAPVISEDDYVETDFGDFYIDEDTLAPPYQEPLPFDDSAHEFGMGIGKFFKEMPESMKPDWEDYLEYVERLGDMPGGKLTYDEWHRMMRRRR